MAVVKTAADEFSAEVYNFVAGCCKGICLCAASGENKFAVFYCKRFDKRQFRQLRFCKLFSYHYPPTVI